MIKLFAIFTVLAAMPVSALAEQVALAKPAAIHCAKDALDSAYTAPLVAVTTNTGDAQIAR